MIFSHTNVTIVTTFSFNALISRDRGTNVILSQILSF